MIPASDARRLEYLSAGPGNPQVVFVVLIADELFVESADSLKNFAWPAAIRDRIHEPFISDVVKSRSTDRIGGVIGSRNGLLHIASCLCPGWAADIVCACCSEGFKAAEQVIRGIFRMG